MSAHTIIDSHIHFITQKTSEKWRKARGDRLATSPRRRLDPAAMEKLTATMEQAASRMRERHLKRGGVQEIVLPSSGKEAAEWWLKEFDECGIERGVFLSPFPFCEEIKEFLQTSPRFVGYTWLNPADPDAPRILEEEHRAGLKGVKLYPPLEQVHVDDKACYPFYEKCAELGMVVLIHFGVSVGYTSDLKFANPLDLHLPARDFPEVTFIVAHLGAGFMREALFLAYQLDNVFFDTSGSNNWRFYLPYTLSLEEIFRKFIQVAGIERILYGSDSTVFPRGYRRKVLQEQLEVLDSLPISEEEREKILSGNISRLLNL